jgi:hypothetical protein
MLPVTTIGDGYFMCRIEHKDLVSADGGPLPDIGGMSGGPALLVERLHYPLVGVITEYEEAFGLRLLRMATLDSVEEKDFLQSSL